HVGRVPSIDHSGEKPDTTPVDRDPRGPDMSVSHVGRVPSIDHSGEKPDTAPVGMTPIPTYKRAKPRFVRARFQVTDSDHVFTGDSIGLAAGLVAYAQLLRPEIHKHERFIALEAAFTGCVDAGGRLTPVSAYTLRKKIERAFFSPIRYLVLPQKNFDTARAFLDDLARAWPRRRLHLVGATTLRDVIDNLNIVRAERVCMGQFVARKAYKYTRATKVQVPLLLGLTYLLVCLIYPKAWVGFDWNPRHVSLMVAGFETMNRDSVFLWYHEFDCDLLASDSRWQVGDIDGDGKNEIAIAPKLSSTCVGNAELFVFDDNGRQLFRRSCTIPDEYPVVTTQNLYYGAGYIDIINTNRGSIVLSRAERSYPAHKQFKFWNARGDLVGWYTNAGQSGAHGNCFKVLQDTGFCFLSFNNRMDCACLFVLNPFGSYGVSPPYVDSQYPAVSQARRGNQLCYILFPRTDVNFCVNELYDNPYLLQRDEDSVLRVSISEKGADGAILDYYVSASFRVFRVRASDKYQKVRDSLVNDGRLPDIVWTSYLDSLASTVKYWTDSGWISEGALRSASPSLF
ncbi:MAG: hypothetical protein AB1772_10090, partial [Candidatus Zixiibacteriota bacterium]